MKPEELLQHATEFAFFPPGLEESNPNSRHFRVFVSRRSEGKWAVVNSGLIWDGEDWIYESMSSNRTDDFIAKSRFPLNEAVEIAIAATETIRPAGLTYAEYLEWDAKRLAKKENKAV